MSVTSLSLQLRQMQLAAPVLLCVRGRPDDGGWCEAACRAAASVNSGALPILVQDEMPDRVDGRWSAIVGHGMEFAADIVRVARANPTVPCMLTDYIERSEGGTLPNLCCVDWRWDEGAFLAGALAAKLSTSGTVGVLGGVPCRTQYLAMTAFVRGARLERPDVAVLTAQAGSFDDEDRGTRLANSLFDEGVDVLLHTADSTGRGAIRAAERRDRAMIGFMNRDDSSHACVKALISTDVEIVVTLLLQDIVAGRFRPGVVACGLASDRQRFDMFEGVEATARKRVDELAGLIASGQLSVRAEEIAP